MINPNDPLELASPEQVVDLLAPEDWGDEDFGPMVDTLDSIRDANEWWLVMTDYGLRCWVECAELY